MEATDGHTLRLAGRRPGSYVTPMFDTREPECSFGRLVVDGRFEGVKLEVIAAATDETDVFIDDQPQNLERYLKNPQVPADAKAGALLHLPSRVRHVNTRDILLYGLKGRYIWVYVALHPTEECDCELEGIRLETPKVSFIEHFPEAYRGNDFFERYLAVFQSMFLDVEHMVDNVPRLLDYRTTPDENVEYLAEWLGIGNRRGLFSTAQLRQVIENIDLFQGIKGTKRALEEILLLLTGIRPRIMEHFQWQRPGFSPAQLALGKKLYGGSAHHFCVMLDLTKRELDVGESDIRGIIEDYSPLGSQFELVFLKFCNRTDTHCYLDVNAALSVPEIAELGDGALGGHITIG